MSKALIGSLIALSFAFAPEALAAKKKSKSGISKSTPHSLVLNECRRLHGGGNAIVEAYWGSNYGRTGWWCRTRSR